MKSAIGIDESDIIRIPALFEKYEGYAPALMPNMVNAAFMNGHLLMADPRGPIENQKDLVQEYVKGLLSKEGIEVHFLDDLQYHNRGGNVHCATNVTRAFY
jgi:protein-arginine deiminase